MPTIGLGQQAVGPEATSDKATIQALLLEVRQLRLAIERSNSLVPRISIAAQRFQAQQDRVDRLSKELRDLRVRIMEDHANNERMATALKRMETEVAQATDLKVRQDLENTFKAVTAQMEQRAAQEEQVKAQEGELVSQLQNEQAKLNELSDQLNTLDKKLEQQQ